MVSVIPLNFDHEMLELTSVDQRILSPTSGNPGIFLCPAVSIPDGYRYLLIDYLFIL